VSSPRRASDTAPVADVAVFLTPEADDRVDEQHGGEAADDDGPDGEPLPEVEDRTGLRRHALVGAEGRDGAAGQGQCRDGRVQRSVARDAMDECDLLHPVGR